MKVRTYLSFSGRNVEVAGVVFLKEFQNFDKFVVILLVLNDMEVGPPVTGVEAPVAGPVLEDSMSVTDELLR